jgi:hypothetical protein
MSRQRAPGLSLANDIHDRHDCEDGYKECSESSKHGFS